MGQSGVPVATEVALQDAPVGRPVEDRPPFFEFPDAFGRFLGVQLRHAPLVEHFSAAHRVAEVHFPVVVRPDVGHGRGDAAFGHDRVCLAEQALADDGDFRAVRVRFQRRPQSRSARSDHYDVVSVPFGRHVRPSHLLNILPACRIFALSRGLPALGHSTGPYGTQWKSWSRPEATSQT
jgi:hypothetical protein